MSAMNDTVPTVVVGRAAAFGDVRLPERFWAKVHPEPNTGCWLWGAGTFKSGDGYGQFRYEGAPVRAHVLSYRTLVGPVDAGLVVRHQCDVPQCVNPEHLLPGTQADNIHDMTSRGRHGNMAKTHCKRGHEFSVSNTISGPRASRHCRECKRAEGRRYQRQLRLARR